MTSRSQAATGWLLLTQGVVLGLVSFISTVLIPWAPDEDVATEADWEQWRSGALHEQAAAASAVLVLLAVLSVVLGAGRLLGRPVGTTPLVAALLGGALAVGLYGSPVLAAVFVLAAGVWAVVLRRGVDRPAAPQPGPAVAGWGPPAR